MWLMLQDNSPDDFVEISGETHSVRDIAQAVFSSVGLEYEKYVTVDTSLFRPTEKVILTGNPSKIIERY
jgi:GDPmannose 4,6-dehydratase